MASFVNFSNHPSSRWDIEQLAAAQEMGNVIDVPFPAVPSDASREEVEDMAKQFAQKIINLQPVAVMAQGEFTLAFDVVAILKQKGITTLAACSDRNTVENPDGSKTSVFKFVQFREY